MKVEYTRKAQSDLAELHTHIAAQDPQMAQSVAIEIKARCDGLVENPFLNPATDLPNVRRMPLSRYPFTVFYRVNQQRQIVFVARVVRNSRIRNLNRLPR